MNFEAKNPHSYPIQHFNDSKCLTVTFYCGPFLLRAIKLFTEESNGLLIALIIGLGQNSSNHKLTCISTDIKWLIPVICVQFVFTLSKCYMLFAQHLPKVFYWEFAWLLV